MVSALVSGAPTRRERRKAEMRARIVASASSLFAERGIAATTIFEITESADVAEKTFYNHFPSKQHLISHFAERVVEDNLRLLAEVRRTPGGLRERVAAFAAGWTALLEDAAPLRRELILEIVRLTQIDGSGPERTRDLHAAWAALVRDARRGGDAQHRYSADFLADMAVAAFGTLGINWAREPEYPMRERLAECADLLGHAFAARRGGAASVAPSRAAKRRSPAPESKENPP